MLRSCLTTVILYYLTGALLTASFYILVVETPELDMAATVALWWPLWWVKLALFFLFISVNEG